MDGAWGCPLCDHCPFDRVKELAMHLQDWHDEWLATNQLPRTDAPLAW
jgi:hypothetical protein